MTPVCPTCNRPASAKNTRFGVRHDCCGLWSWDGAPLVSKETHEARMTAHAAFDELWRTGLMKRKDAYKALAAKMEIAPKDCHIKLMSAEIAARVPAVAQEIRQEVGGRA